MRTPRDPTPKPTPPTCERCGASVPRGYRLCDACHWQRVIADQPTEPLMLAATTPAPTQHTPAILCDLCDEGTDTPYIHGTSDGLAVAYCANCLADLCRVLEQVSAHRPGNRYSDWPDRNHLTMQTTRTGNAADAIPWHVDLFFIVLLRGPRLD